MANLTDNKEVVEKARRLVSHPMAVAELFKGSMAKINAAGYLGAVGDLDGSVLREGIFLMDGAGFTISDVGDVVYASDDQTISTTQGANELAIGKIVNFVSATQV